MQATHRNPEPADFTTTAARAPRPWQGPLAGRITLSLNDYPSIDPVMSPRQHGGRDRNGPPCAQ